MEEDQIGDEIPQGNDLDGRALGSWLVIMSPILII